MSKKNTNPFKGLKTWGQYKREARELAKAKEPPLSLEVLKVMLDQARRRRMIGSSYTVRRLKFMIAHLEEKQGRGGDPKE